MSKARPKSIPLSRLRPCPPGMFLIISPCPDCGMIVQHAYRQFFSQPGETVVKVNEESHPLRAPTMTTELHLEVHVGALFACRCGAHWSVEQITAHSLGPMELRPPAKE